MESVISEIVKERLIENGYDGLYNTEKECACTIDDLVACGESLSRCVAARKTDCDCTGECEFHLKPADECPTTH
jgi:hypothetical protein